jgi:cohesin loading factor subunit SCC2
MQASTLRRDFFTSLVGTAPVADLLADLPMPTHMPTPLERCVRGELPLSPESRKLLSTAEPGLCNKITKALLSVDTSFLAPKSHVSSEPYVPTQQAPPLVYSVFSKGLTPQPTLRLNRLDSTKYTSPVKTETTSDAPLLAANVPNEPTVKQDDALKDSKPVKKSSSSRRLSRTDSDDRARKKQSHRPPVPTGPMMVSIDRSRLKQRQRHKVTSESSTRAGTKKVKKKREDKVMVVRVERKKIAGSMGTKAASPRSNSFTMMTAPPPSQPIEPRKPVKKKKRRQSHHGDPARVAAIQHYSFMVDSLLDTEDQLSDDNLLSRNSVVHVAAETCKLKQLSLLHEISVESLVRLIGIMDRHVLDSAELQMNTLPEEGEGDVRTWREAIRERVLRSLDAALAILHINTAPNMPKNVHQEESLEQIISVTKFHLENNIYPEFDPVYRAGTKEGGALPRQKRRQGGSHSASRDVQAVYRKLTEVVENLALLLETQPLTDTTVLQISSLGTFPFFVENVSSLQLSSLRLVRAVFSRYEKHRDLILEDIFASLARLPTTKRNLRSFKLSNGTSVQMVTALILQLVQCIVSPPDYNSLTTPLLLPDTPTDPASDTPTKADPDVQMINSYELALTTGKTFLSTFMKKCCGGKEEEDFRPLFDNFVQDLLTTLNLPEWPACEVLLTLLGVLLVHSFSNRSNEHSLRVTSLDHLGVIAARLRRDAASSVDTEHGDLVAILAQVMQGRLERKTPSPTMLLTMDAFSENSRHLQKALIAYLHKRSQTDPSCAYSRDFYIGQWLRDTQLELEKAMKEAGEEMDPITTDGNGDVPAISSSAAALQQAEVKKETLHSLIGTKNQSELKHLEGVLDDKSAGLVVRYLASSRALSRSFDVYLQQLIRVLSEPEVRMRTRAMKALSCIIDSDPSILSRPDMQRAVQCRFMDQSTLVREAAVDLLGRSVLSRPELTAQYYDMLSERILDTGVSVRKRVIKILKDVCVLQPQFPKTSEICVKIMRRISDEEGIKQLVSSVFRELWFTMPPAGAAQRESLERRVGQVTAVVGSCKEYEWFEQLLQQLLKTDDKSSVQLVLKVCQMMVDCLVETLLTLDETSGILYQ